MKSISAVSVVVALLGINACSSSDAPDPTPPSVSSTISVESTVSDPEATVPPGPDTVDVDPVVTDSTATDPTVTEGVSELVSTTDAPFVIDGPAQVELE